MELSDILHYFRVIEKDSRLTAWHVALLMALLFMAIRQGRLVGIRASRNTIMSKSHILTAPTYHKYFKELQELGYICYRPSYHPGVKSEIDFLKRLNR